MTGEREPDAGLRRLLDDATAEQAARARERARWLRQQAGEESSVLGLLMACFEAGMPVELYTVAGSRHQGVLRAVGPDWCRVDGAWRTYVQVSGIAQLRAPVQAAHVMHPSPQTARLAELLAELAPERPQVRLHLANETVDGTLLAGGTNVLSVQPPGASLAVHVPLAALAAVSVHV